MKIPPRRPDRTPDPFSNSGGAIGDLTPPPDFPSAPAPEPDAEMASELNRAHQIQSRLLPSSLPAVPGFDLAALYLPATQVGGDYYDVLPLPGGRFGIIVADVSGKGISAAMIMVMARTVFHSVARKSATAKATVLAANEALAPDLPAGLFLTVAYAILDPARSSLSVVNCGHHPPLLWTTFDRSPVVETLLVNGPAMGLVRGVEFERAVVEREIVLQPGDHLLFHTDGANEAMDVNSREFGDRGLFKAVMRGGTKDAGGMAQEVVNAVLHHRGIAPASDDLTVLDVWKLP
ncbi:MAG: PP2C family protein-serine/threonine phosphatase [Planctomycetes bacterium]|nr:PP2C family protein-serine/threonine phosphatase [Planctomycetota bacterium]